MEKINLLMFLNYTVIIVLTILLLYYYKKREEDFDEKDEDYSSYEKKSDALVSLNGKYEDNLTDRNTLINTISSIYYTEEDFYKDVSDCIKSTDITTRLSKYVFTESPVISRYINKSSIPDTNMLDKETFIAEIANLELTEDYKTKISDILTNTILDIYLKNSFSTPDFDKEYRLYDFTSDDTSNFIPTITDFSDYLTKESFENTLSNLATKDEVSKFTYDIVTKNSFDVMTKNLINKHIFNDFFVKFFSENMRMNYIPDKIKRSEKIEILDNNKQKYAELYGYYNIYLEPLEFKKISTVDYTSVYRKQKTGNVDFPFFEKYSVTEYGELKLSTYSGDDLSNHKQFVFSGYYDGSSNSEVNVIIREYITLNDRAVLYTPTTLTYTAKKIICFIEDHISNPNDLYICYYNDINTNIYYDKYDSTNYNTSIDFGSTITIALPALTSSVKNLGSWVFSYDPGTGVITKIIHFILITNSSSIKSIYYIDILSVTPTFNLLLTNYNDRLGNIIYKNGIYDVSKTNYNELHCFLIYLESETCLCFKEIRNISIVPATITLDIQKKTNIIQNDIDLNAMSYVNSLLVSETTNLINYNYMVVNFIGKKLIDTSSNVNLYSKILKYTTNAISPIPSNTFIGETGNTSLSYNINNYSYNTTIYTLGKNINYTGYFGTGSPAASITNNNIYMIPQIQYKQSNTSDFIILSNVEGKIILYFYNAYLLELYSEQNMSVRYNYMLEKNVHSVKKEEIKLFSDEVIYDLSDSTKNKMNLFFETQELKSYEIETTVEEHYISNAIFNIYEITERFDNEIYLYGNIRFKNTDTYSVNANPSTNILVKHTAGEGRSIDTGSSHASEIISERNTFYMNSKLFSMLMSGL